MGLLVRPDNHEVAGSVSLKRSRTVNHLVERVLKMFQGQGEIYDLQITVEEWC
jgi:hypothetical protein